MELAGPAPGAATAAPPARLPAALRSPADKPRRAVAALATATDQEQGGMEAAPPLEEGLVRLPWVWCVGRCRCERFASGSLVARRLARPACSAGRPSHLSASPRPPVTMALCWPTTLFFGCFTPPLRAPIAC